MKRGIFLLLGLGGVVIAGVVAGFLILGKSPKQTEPDNAAPKPAEVEVAKAGTLEKSGVRVEFGAEAAVKDITVRAEAVESNNRNLVCVSPTVAIKAERAVFKEPLKVTLPFDPAKLPAGAKPEDLFVVLHAGRATERLSLKPRIDAGKNTASFELDRLIPMVNTQGGDGGAEVTVDLSANKDALLVIDNMTADVHVRAPAALEAEAKAFAPTFKMLLGAARERLQKSGFRVPSTTIVVDYIPLRPTVWAQASGGYHIEVNSATFGKSPASYPAFALAHELFHLVQQTYKIANIRALKDATGVDVDPLDGRWMDEGTAEFVPARLTPAYAPFPLSGLRLDFGYRALETYDDDATSPPGELHQYKTYVFWAYLDSRYDALALIAKCYEMRMSNRFTELGADQDQASNRGTFNALAVLDHVLKTTPDRKGQTHNLREVYADFLLQYYWFKAFEPLRTPKALAILGGPKELRLPASPTTALWNLPDDQNGQRVYQKSETFHGDNYAISKAFRISSMTAKGKNERGDLTLTLKAGRGAEKDRIVMIAFPVKNGAQNPLIGDAKTPIVIPAWETHGEAIVWVLDFSRRSHGDITLTAEMGSPGKLEIATKRSPMPGHNHVVVTSENLAKLDGGKADLEYVLWSASSPDGTFRPIQGSKQIVRPGAKVTGLKPGDADLLYSQRISQNQFVLVDRVTNHDRSKPVYYKVYERWIKSDGSPGELSQSPVSDVGPIEMEVKVNRANATETAKDQYTDEQGHGTLLFWVTIACSTQDYEPPGVPIVVRAGKFTGHFWSPRYEGKVRYGGHSGDHKFAVYLPIHETGPVTFTANVNGQQLSKTVQIIVKPKADVVAAREKQLKYYQDEHVKRTAATKRYLDGAKQRIPFLEGRLAEESKRKDASTWDLQIELMQARVSLERYEKIYMEKDEETHKINVATHTRDYATLLKSILRMMDLVTAERDLYDRERAEELKLRDKKFADPRMAEHHRKTYADEKAKKAARKAEEVAGARLGTLSSLLGVGGYDPFAKMKYAADVGDAALLKQIADRLIALKTEHAQLTKDQYSKNSELQTVGRLYQAYAGHLAQVTGGRDEAAKLWTKGHELVYTGTKIPPLSELEVFEPWWPAGWKTK